MPELLTYRLFIAFDLPPSIKNLLHDVVERLAESQADVKWTERDNFHITLEFLAEVPCEKIPALEEILQQTLADHRAITLQTQNIGAFPSLARPRVIWYGFLDITHQMSLLSREFKPLLKRVIAPHDDSQPFHPHATLGRVKSIRNLSRLRSSIDKINATALRKTIIIDQITLYRSQLSTTGATYTPLRIIKLRQPADSVMEG